MAYPSFAPRLVLAAALVLGPAPDARAGQNDLPFPHIRTTDARLRALIDEATEASPTVRTLIGRISTSNVVVYVACEYDSRIRATGRLNFVGAAGGLRYVIIHLKARPSRVKAIATLAHELQHAAEIADNPSIVDETSLAREYERIGYRSHSVHGSAFDTKEAVDVGRRVIEELENSSRLVNVARSAS
ncbi:MAG TPA: hypothetical protein VM846_05625 [Vicinamibacterales bacterium]|nr:hypothetical protein [Vicinamibacterales bacterium]